MADKIFYWARQDDVGTVLALTFFNEEANRDDNLAAQPLEFGPYVDGELVRTRVKQLVKSMERLGAEGMYVNAELGLVMAPVIISAWERYLQEFKQV